MKTTLLTHEVALACIPVRKEASDRAEMVNQLLFGEGYSVVEEEEKWVSIASEIDDYRGWIDRKHHVWPINHKVSSIPVVNSSGSLDEIDGNAAILLSPGSRLPGACNGQLGLDGKIFNINAEIGRLERRELKRIAYQFLNTPYLWGGRSIWGIDCSGLMQVLFTLIGIDLPRDASQQIHCGEHVDLKDSLEGDLAFFSNPKGSITHVGLVLSDNKIIHASGKVRIDSLNQEGILIEDSRIHSHSLHSLRRL